MRTPRIVQTRSRLTYLWVLLPMLLGALLLVVWGDYIEFKPPTVDRVAPLQKRLDEQARKIRLLESERGRLREQVVALERASQIDEEAMREVREQLKQKQSGYLEMKEELNLLRGIVDTGVKSDGLNIQGFSLEPVDEPHRYRFRFTLRQALRNAGTAVGWIRLTLEGDMKGESRVLGLKQLTNGKDERLKMRFRHFQDIDGLIEVPEGFSPERVIVEINPTNNRLPRIKQAFDWRVVD